MSHRGLRSSTRSHGDRARRLLTVSPGGTLVLIDAIGVPARGIDAPISDEQLDRLEFALDSSNLDERCVRCGPRNRSCAPQTRY